MKLLWLTPFLRASAIGRFSAIVCDALVDAGHSCTIVRTELPEIQEEDPHETRCDVIGYQDLNPAVDPADYDAVILNIGDNYRFHAGIFPFLDTPLSVGIFHDFYLFNLFNGRAASEEWTEPRMLAEVMSVYGTYSEADWLAHHDADTPLWDRVAEIADSIPMTEWIALRCLSAVAHSGFYRHRIDAVCPGPSAVIPLAWTREADTTSASTGSNAKNADQLLKLVTFGVMNPNKCADRLIEAIGSNSDLARRIEYRLVGSIDDDERDRLTALAQDKGVALQILGRVSDEELEQELAEADIVSCLRKPVLEGGSASAIEAMLVGRTMLVCDAGFYGDLPDDCVVKIDPQARPDDIASALKTLLENDADRAGYGERARRYAKDTFTAERYARDLVALAERTVEAAPFLDLCKRLAWDLERVGVSPASPTIDRVAAMVEAMHIAPATAETEADSARDAS